MKRARKRINNRFASTLTLFGFFLNEFGWKGVRSILDSRSLRSYIELLHFLISLLVLYNLGDEVCVCLSGALVTYCTL